MRATKLRHKETGLECTSDRFNPSNTFEVIVCYPDGSGDSDYIRNFEVWLESQQEWQDLQNAFSDHDVITDNHNTIFFEPPTPEDRERGYTLY